MLHHLSREEAMSLITQMQKHTNKDGLNVITIFTKNGDFYRKNPDTDKFYPEKDVLKKLYANWEVLEYEEIESQTWIKRPDGNPMINMSEKLIAQKKEYYSKKY